MRLPLGNLLKKQAQVQLASLQDEAADIMYSLCPSAVLHGGTAVWRCYNGNRFSEDLDFYASVGTGFRKSLEIEAHKRNLSLVKFRETENSIYAKISDSRTEVSLEIAKRKKAGILAQYEKADGSFMSIFSLTKEELLVEKANAFLGRKLVRDLYDVYFLSATADAEKARRQLHELAKNAPKPVDEKNLKALLYSGAVPSFRQMLNAIKRRVDQ